MKACVLCTKSFDAYNNSQKYCVGCKTRTCLHCKKQFVVVGMCPGRLAKFCSRKCQYKCGAFGRPPGPLTPSHRRAISRAARERVRKGLHNFWQGGKTAQRDRIRNSVEYKIWRTSVFQRDDYTCRKCKIRGGYLQADHIKPFAHYPDLRFSLSNGRTLCIDCHRKTPTWGRRSLRQQS